MSYYIDQYKITFIFLALEIINSKIDLINQNLAEIKDLIQDINDLLMTYQ